MQDTFQDDFSIQNSGSFVAILVYCMVLESPRLQIKHLDHYYELGDQVYSDPREPEKDPCENEKQLQTFNFWVPCEFSVVHNTIRSSRHNSQTPRLLKIFQLPARHLILHMRWCWSCTRWCWHRSFYDLTQERIYLQIYQVDVDMLCLRYII